jgi:hypothetical protein
MFHNGPPVVRLDGDQRRDAKRARTGSVDLSGSDADYSGHSDKRKSTAVTDAEKQRVASCIVAEMEHGAESVLPKPPETFMVRQSSIDHVLDDTDTEFPDIESLVKPGDSFSDEYVLLWRNAMRQDSSIGSLPFDVLVRFSQEVYDEWVCNRTYGGSSNNPMQAVVQARQKFGIRDQDRVGVAAIEKRWIQCAYALTTIDIALVRQVQTLRSHGTGSSGEVVSDNTTVHNVMTIVPKGEGGHLRLTDINPMTDLTRLLTLQRQMHEHSLLAMQNTRDVLVSMDSLFRMSHPKSRSQVTGLGSLQINRYYHQNRDVKTLSTKGALMRSLWGLLSRMQARRVGASVYKPLTVDGQNTGSYILHSTIDEFVRNMTALSRSSANFEMSMCMSLESFSKDFEDRHDEFYFPYLTVNHGVYAFKGGLMDAVNRQLIFFDGDDPNVQRIKDRCDATIALFETRERQLRSKLIPQADLLAQSAREAIETSDDGMRIKRDMVVIEDAKDAAEDECARLGREMEYVKARMDKMYSSKKTVDEDGTTMEELTEEYKDICTKCDAKKKEIRDMDNALQTKEREYNEAMEDNMRVLHDAEYLHTDMDNCMDALKMLRGLLPGEDARHGLVAEKYFEQAFPFDDFISWLTPVCVPCIHEELVNTVPCEHHGGGPHDMFTLSWYHQMPTPRWEKIFTDQGLPSRAVQFSAYIAVGRLNVPYGKWESHTFVTNTRGEPKTGKSVVQKIKAYMRSKSNHAYFMNWSENKFGMSMVLGSNEKEVPSVLFVQDYTNHLCKSMTQDQFLLTAEQAENTSWPRKNKSTLNIRGHFPHTDYSGNPPMPYTGREATRRVVTTVFPRRIKKEDPNLMRDLKEKEILQLAWKSTIAYNEWAVQYGDKGLWDRDENGDGALCSYFHDRQRDNESSNSPLLHFMDTEVDEHFIIRRDAVMSFSKFKKLLAQITKGKKQEDWSTGQFINTFKQFDIDWVDRRVTNHPMLGNHKSGQYLVGIEPRAAAPAPAPAATS